MYNTKTAVVSTGSSYIDAGINENIKLKEVNVRKSPTDLDFLEIVFEDTEGRTATFTEWKNQKNMWIKTDEDLQRRDDLQFGRILQIINCFVDNVPEASFTTFAEMINWVKNTLDSASNKNALVRLKIVYDRNNYTRVSTNGIFIEPMSVEKSKIKKLARDNFERQAMPDSEDNVDPLTNVNNDSTPVTGDDDLPF